MKESSKELCLQISAYPKFLFFPSLIFAFAINWSKNVSNKETNGMNGPLEAKKQLQMKKKVSCQRQSNFAACYHSCLRICKEGFAGTWRAIQSGSSLLALENYNLGYRKMERLLEVKGGAGRRKWIL